MEKTFEPKLSGLVCEAYEGDVANNLFHGQGRARFVGGHVYEGEFAHGLLHGKGVFTWIDGVQYSGDFVDNAMCGSGSYVWPDGSTYTGSVEHGKRHGLGTFVSADGATYTGNWRHGMRHGHGKLVYASGDAYEGQWENNHRHGRGVMRYRSGNVYDGEWLAGVRHGQGCMTWHDRHEVYTGGWVDGQQHGKGEHVWKRTRPNNSQFVVHNRYLGDWLHGRRHGYGEFFYASGARHSGHWVDNRKHGPGTFVFDNGFSYSGEFVQDAFAGEVSPEAFAIIFTATLGLREEPSAEASQNLERVVVRHMSELRLLYQFYAQCALPNPENVYVLTRLLLHRLLKDADVYSLGLTVATVDRASDEESSASQVFHYGDLFLLRNFFAVLVRVGAAAYRCRVDEAFSKLISKNLAPLAHRTSRSAVGGIILRDERLLAAVQPLLPGLHARYASLAAESGKAGIISGRTLVLALHTAGVIDDSLSVARVLQVMRFDNKHMFSEDDECNLDSEMVFLEFVETVVGCALARSGRALDLTDLPDDLAPLLSFVRSVAQ